MVNFDVFWKILFFLSVECFVWLGLMQVVYEGNYIGKFSVLFFFMIDMILSDVICVMFMLNFVLCYVKFYDILIFIIMFDQLLWLKVFFIVNIELVDSEVCNVVVCLGVFYVQMSFLGVIGYLMVELGLKEFLEMIYVFNVVDYMLSGKVVL